MSDRHCTYALYGVRRLTTSPAIEAHYRIRSPFVCIVTLVCSHRLSGIDLRPSADLLRENSFFFYILYITILLSICRKYNFYKVSMYVAVTQATQVGLKELLHLGIFLSKVNFQKLLVQHSVMEY